MNTYRVPLAKLEFAWEQFDVIASAYVFHDGSYWLKILADVRRCDEGALLSAIPCVEPVVIAMKFGNDGLVSLCMLVALPPAGTSVPAR